jgi:hypothetical protein
MKNHQTWMILGCILPLLLIFSLPFFGAGSGELLFVFIVFCFGIHLLMVGHHQNHGDGNHNSRKEGGDHGSH